MAETCNAEHPDQPGVLCDVRTDRHRAFHSNREHGLAWPDKSYPQPVPRSSTGRKKSTKVTLARWLGHSEQEWVAQALETVRAWLATHPERFTTAEAWWPLLDAPRDKRVMSRVVATLLRDKMIVEVGATRLRGTYTTRDGHQFEENKLVPIYQRNNNG